MPAQGDEPSATKEELVQSTFFSMLTCAAKYALEWTPKLMFSSNNKEHEIEEIKETRLKTMTKHCTRAHFSCHSELTSNGPVFHAIYLPNSTSVWKSSDLEVVQELCAKLDPLAQFDEDKFTLKEIMNLVRENPGWHACHYAVACGFTSYLTNILIEDSRAILDCPTPDGRYPLHIAAENGQIECIELLINAGASLTQQDTQGRTVAHCAAASSVDVLQALWQIPAFSKCFLLVDKEGFSPFAYAIRAENYETVKFLITHNATVSPANSAPPLNSLIGLKPSESLDKILTLIMELAPDVAGQVDENDRTVFHNNLDPQILKILLRKFHQYVNLNQKDVTGMTALHLAIGRENLDSMVILLTHGANVNESDGTGMTSLMMAAAIDSIVLVKTLLVFGADASLKNKFGHDVFNCLSTSENRAEIKKLLIMATGKDRPQSHLMEDFGQKLAIECAKKEKRAIFGLSLDGGGIRGLVLIQILIEIEKKLGHSIIDHFNWLAGTSTGAILALALSQGKSLTYCRDLYFRLKDDIFIGNKPYSVDSLERLLKEELGASTTMEDIAKNGKRVVVTTCDANIAPPQLHLIRSYKLPPVHGHDVEEFFSDPKAIPAWKAARCSSAAPIYFPSVDSKWMDGGLIANNPCCSLLTEIHTYNTGCRKNSKTKPEGIGCVLSLGTGIAPLARCKSIDFDLPMRFMEYHKVPDVVNYLFHLKEILIEQVTCSDGAAISCARSWCHSLSTPYFRFSPQLSEKIDLAETNNAMLIEMLWQTKVYIASEKHSVDELIDLLKPCH